MECPKASCKHPKSVVVDTRTPHSTSATPVPEGTRIRVRKCIRCGERFKTIEQVWG